MRDTPSPAGEHPGTFPPTPAPMQMAGRRSGEGSASVLEHLVQDRTSKNPNYRAQAVPKYATDAGDT